jgi:putative zinc finger/helix-turn-helix YgiT family protein
MTCFECGQNRLSPAPVRIKGTRHGESFIIELQGLKCGSCGFSTIDSDQSAEFTRLVSDAYRSAHGLLTSVEIRSKRVQLKLNQQEFSTYLGAGSASVKRWESGQIQDRAMDELIRLKTDPAAARRNLRSLERRIPEELIISDEGDMALALMVNEVHYQPRTPMTVETVAMPMGEVVTEACMAA